LLYCEKLQHVNGITLYPIAHAYFKHLKIMLSALKALFFT